MDLDEFKRGFISRGELPPEDLLTARNTGMSPAQYILNRQIEAQRIPHPSPSHGSYVSSTGYVRRESFFIRLLRLAKVLLVLAIAGLAILFAFDATRPLTYMAISALTQPTIVPGSEISHIKQTVPGTTNYGPKTGHLKALRGAPVAWERMNAKQKTALASVHAIFVSSNFYPDMTITESQWKYLQKAIPSYLGTYAKTDPVYSRLLSDYYQTSIGGQNREAALAALAIGSSNAMPPGRGRLSNWFAHKALAGQNANWERMQAEREARH